MTPSILVSHRHAPERWAALESRIGAGEGGSAINPNARYKGYTNYRDKAAVQAGCDELKQ
jgi:hypothetical protein